MHIRRGYVDGPHGQIHYRRCGDGMPLLLCHQSPSSSRQFLAAYAPLAARGFSAIGVDTPGFGASDAPGAPPTIEDYAEAIVGVLDALAIPIAHILGQHTGSMIAMAAAIAHPERFERLVLNSPTPFNAAQRAEWINTLVARQRAWTVKPDGSHLQEMWDRRCRVSTGWTDALTMHRHVVEMFIAGDTLWYGHHASLVYDQLSQLQNITHPTLVLTNTGDALFDLCKSAVAVRPDFAYAELQGGTHDIVDEQPEAWCDAVSDFLNGDHAAKPKMSASR